MSTDPPPTALSDSALARRRLREQPRPELCEHGIRATECDICDRESRFHAVPYVVEPAEVPPQLSVINVGNPPVQVQLWIGSQAARDAPDRIRREATLALILGQIPPSHAALLAEVPIMIVSTLEPP